MALQVYLFSECIGVCGIKLLVCPHHGDEILGIGQVDDVVRIPRQHVYCLDLLPADLTAFLGNVLAEDLLLFQRFRCLFL